MEKKVTPFPELAPSTPIQTGEIIKKIYGRYLEEFQEGDLYLHPREFTVDRSFAQEFATVFMEANPLFLSAPYAQAHGFADMLVSPLQVFSFFFFLPCRDTINRILS